MSQYSRRVAFFSSVALLLLLLPGDTLAQRSTKNSSDLEKGGYRGKSQIFSLKGELLGGEFRISNVIPLRGDFSKYERIEASPLRSLIGPNIPLTVMEDYGSRLFRQFQHGGRFNNLGMIDSYAPEVPPNDVNSVKDSPSLDRIAPTAEGEDRDTLEGPMLSWDDMYRFDELRRQRLEKEMGAPERPPRTLVIVGEVIDYAKGNRWLQLLPLNLGNSEFAVRFRYYDKETGEEVGRQVITGEVKASNLGVFGFRNVLSGIVEGVVDQITRRAVSAER